MQAVLTFIAGFVSGALALFVFVNWAHARWRKPLTVPQRDVLTFVHRALDDTARAARDAGDDVIRHRVAALRTVTADGLNHPTKLVMFADDVRTTLVDLRGRLQAMDVSDRTEACKALFFALNRADDHAQTLAITVRPYQTAAAPNAS